MLISANEQKNRAITEVITAAAGQPGQAAVTKLSKFSLVPLPQQRVI